MLVANSIGDGNSMRLFHQHRPGNSSWTGIWASLYKLEPLNTMSWDFTVVPSFERCIICFFKLEKHFLLCFAKFLMQCLENGNTVKFVVTPLKRKISYLIKGILFKFAGTGLMWWIAKVAMRHTRVSAHLRSRYKSSPLLQLGLLLQPSRMPCQWLQELQSSHLQ